LDFRQRIGSASVECAEPFQRQSITFFLIMETPSHIGTPASRKALPTTSSWKRTVLIVLGTLVLGCGITAAASAWWVKRNIYASPMQPVRLNTAEQQTLDAKLKALQSPPAAVQPRVLTPEEQRRTLILTQKEINAYLAEQNLGEQVRVDLGEGTVSATMIVPIPPDSGLPLVSGTTLRLTMSVDAVMDANKKLAIKLTDVRLGGISLPNAWLGDLKGVNLVADSVTTDPAIQRFLAGIKEMEIHPDGLRVLLNE
jgi:hypothetical protein